MIIDDLNRIIRQNVNLDNKAYLLNLIKEGIQSYILYFIYTNKKFKELIFTGGTCLRRIYGLNRLSVDLDLDYESASNPQADFAEQMKCWFQKEHQLKNIETIVRKGTVKVKLTETAGLFGGIGKQVIFVSVDFSPVGLKKYKTEQNLISTPEFSFIVRNFDLPTMFANKICAFLERNFTHGRDQAVAFKGRDVYDLYWLSQRSRINQYQLKPNMEVLFERLLTKDKRQIFKLLKGKIAVLEDRQLETQLKPFVQDSLFLKSFISSYRETLLKDLSQIISN